MAKKVKKESKEINKNTMSLKLVGISVEDIKSIPDNKKMFSNLENIVQKFCKEVNDLADKNLVSIQPDIYFKVSTNVNKP